jgi:hypothetical protein
MRIDMNLPSVAVVLLVAAAAQELVPVTSALPVKVPFLTAVALYHALTKPPPVALTVLVWAGALTDALGGLPLFCTLSFLLVAYWVARLMQRVFLEATLVQGTLLVACAAVCQTLWTRMWVGAAAPFFAWSLVTALAASAPAGLAAGFVGFAVCGRVDRLSGVVKPMKEGNGILWAETDR